ncbi:RHS repeat-associated core domain-containing protein [Aureibaculum sp. 2210JD6-5]|uniref:RHS repeat domain-containing protein n=1 Tax=Aureibaculum sp. 2210JD6-5 TaxID=3103957 RepID=UPI002AACA1DA|nr:RHS repeat-associated core domain-containing protein [Aureibaculum sp. 2210JD6-5]MDY7394237.1 RHS repeat-associated core domain-containing protein [Aureibaculum sp. 2210JD6-5]
MAENLQGIDYIYNLAGQLKAINDPDGNDPGNDGNNGISTDVFSMTLDYYTGDYNRANIHTATEGKDQYNGNIKAMTWKTTGAVADGMETYYYDYNKNNWLASAGFSAPVDGSGTALTDITRDAAVTANEDVTARNSITLLPGFHVASGVMFTAKIDPNATGGSNSGDYNVTNLTYDQNGNLLSLNRNKDTQNGNNRMDELTYHYKPNLNQLDHVTDKVDEDGVTTNADDIKTQAANNYVYNSIGQLVSNTEEGISYIYNTSGLVTEVQKDNQPLVKFYYNDKGYRVRKEGFVNGTVTNTEHYVRDASGNTLAIYNDNVLKEMPIYGASRLGVHYKDGNKDVYQLTDHLGNVRAVIAKVNNSAAISSSTDYYPFGMPMPGRQTIGGELYRYAYQGQEKDPETGKEAFQLRLWDSRIGRWLTTDPYSQFHSPYLGMGNNPINGVDSDGGCWDEFGNPCPDGALGDVFTDYDGVEWTFGESGWDTNAFASSAVFLTDYSRLLNDLGTGLTIGGFGIANFERAISKSLANRSYVINTGRTLNQIDDVVNFKPQNFDDYLRTASNYKGELRIVDTELRATLNALRGGVKYLGYVGSVGGGIVSYVEFSEGIISGEQFAVDIVMTGVGFIGPIGAGVSAFYFIVLRDSRNMYLLPFERYDVYKDDFIRKDNIKVNLNIHKNLNIKVK